jgi:hypothetical protein
MRMTGSLTDCRATRKRAAVCNGGIIVPLKTC